MRLAHALALGLYGLAMMYSTPHAFAQNDPVVAAASENYIIKFSEPGLLHYSGGVNGLRATEPRANGQRKLDAQSSASVAYRDYLRGQRNGYVDAIAANLNRNAAVLHDYDVMYHGIALNMTAGEAAQLKALPGIVSVEPAGTFELHTDAGPQLIGAPTIWDGSAVPGGIGTRGQDVVISIIDSGANADHPSFANDASCGFSAGNPKLLSAKDCLSPNCVGGNPEDTDPSGTGHGVHTASTAGGNALTTPLSVNGVAMLFPISGVAPCAKIRTYKVCGTNTCDGAAIQAAIQNSITDNADVINFSISGGLAPWGDTDRSFLDAVNADIFVAASAGNTRTETPDPVANVNHRGPWVMSVANSTHDRVQGYLTDVVGGPQDVPALRGTGPGFPDGATTSMVASALTLGNETACNASGGLAAGSMTGRIGLIARGTCSFAEKVTNAQTAGATAVVMYNNQGGPPIVMGALEPTIIPSAMVSLTEGTAIRDFYTSNPNANMTLTGPPVRTVNPAFADVLNAGSLRGPNNTFDVTKPDITNPGTNIYAAIGDIAPAGGEAQFGFLSGTSMSSPHTAGSAALIRAVHPTWTPQEVKSALQLTTKRDGLAQTGLTPWHTDEIGNGRVNLSQAALAGLVMNETFANHLAANPATGGNPRTLNIPSMRRTNCPGQCSWTRTVRNTLGVASTWNAEVEGTAGAHFRVAPSTFSFTGNTAETQVVTIYATMLSTVSAIEFGRVSFVEANSLAPDASMTVAITGTQAPGAPTADLLLFDGLEDISQ